MKSTFIVTSTVNVTKGVGIDRRFEETIDTLQSIHKHFKYPHICFIDNSLVPLDELQIATIKMYATVVHQFEHDLFSTFVNQHESKGFGEAILLDKALKLLHINNIIGDRIFKLSGRYKLAESFDSKIYEDPKFKGKYAARINDWDVWPSNRDRYSVAQRVTYFETRLFSFCESLIDEYTASLQNIFERMMIIDSNWEKCHHFVIPRDKIIEMKPIHVEGNTADNGVYKFE
jgi:hypothetical protein